MSLNAETLRKSKLSTAQRTIVNRALTSGGDLDTALDEAQCCYLAARIAADLGRLEKITTLPKEVSGFFESRDFKTLRLENVDFINVFESLVNLVSDAETYFSCLATLHKRRLKYQKILEVQPIPTINQVGPRGLLQYGTLNPTALVGLLFWRKWFFDIDNRAGQETGYIFEPIVARSIGGESYSAKKSPVKRSAKPEQGRQVDCIFGRKAYEIKLRVTIAASGQGRWGEEMEFPKDCKFSNYIPVLVVFDDTQADKLDELEKAFVDAGGEVFIGERAWAHLEELAGPTMSSFLETYVRSPLKQLLTSAPDREKLPDLIMKTNGREISIQIGENDSLVINRPNFAGTENEAAEEVVA